MFGIKIISEERYHHLLKSEQNYDNMVRELKKDNISLSMDCKSLRQQLNERIREVNKLSSFKRDTLEFFGEADLGSFRVQVCNEACKPCDGRSSRYSFGDYSFCIRPKQES
jgi:hypothetical protein